MLRRLLPYLVAPLALVVMGACAGSGTHNQTGKASACPLIGDLDRITSDVQGADVGDPVKFKVALDRAVTLYVATLARLKKVAPTGLHGDLDKVAAAVQQYRFQEAATDQASLDAFAAARCGRTVASDATSLPPASTIATETTAPTTPSTPAAPETTTVPAVSTAPDVSTVPVVSTTTGNTVEP